MPREEDLPKLNPGEKIEGKHVYTVDLMLGSGAFGAVYRVRNMGTGELWAMKTESTKEKTRILKVERLVLVELRRAGSSHACQIVDSGREKDRNLVFVVMTLTGDSLQSYRKQRPRGRFSLGTALRVGIQCMEGLRDLHGVDYLHRDVKPGNFAVGRKETSEQRTVFILDFGLCRKYRNEKGELKTPRAEAGFRGTVRYASLGSHNQIDLGRKDDLESWFYLLVECTAGRVPWTTENDKPIVKEAKLASRVNESLYRSCPELFKALIEYIDSLTFIDEPDYDFIANVLNKILRENNVEEEELYDWEKSSNSKPPPQKTSPLGILQAIGMGRKKRDTET